MYDADAIEAINVDQLVTATDRILLRGRSRRSSRPAVDLTAAAAAALAESRQRAATEVTVFVRSPAKRPLIRAAAFFATTSIGATLLCLLT